MTSEGGGRGSSLDVDHLGRGSSSQAMDCQNSQRYGSGLPIRVLNYPSEEEEAFDPMAEEDIIALADSDYFPDVAPVESSGTRRARPASNTRRRVHRTGSGSNNRSRRHSPTGDVIIDVSDSEFQDCSSLRTFNARHSQVTDSTEEQEMLRLDAEWLRVSQAYDVLRRTEDVAALDDRDVHAEAYGNAGCKSSSRFWTTLNSIRQTSVDDNDIAAWDMVLARRSNRRGISEKMVSDELMTVMSHPDMQMWTLSQVESIFLEQAHPDWARWDLLETVCTNAVSQLLSPTDIEAALKGTPIEQLFPLEVLLGMCERIQVWRVEDAQERHGFLEAALVNSYWCKEEVWRAYQMLNFRMRVIGDYRKTIATFPSERIEVSVRDIAYFWAILYCGF